MTEQDAFLLSEIQEEFDQQSSSLSHTETQEFNELRKQFFVLSESESKCVTENAGFSEKNYKTVLTEIQDQKTDVSSTHKGCSRSSGGEQRCEEECQNIETGEYGEKAIKNEDNVSKLNGDIALAEGDREKTTEGFTISESTNTEEKTSNNETNDRTKHKLDVVKSIETCKPVGSTKDGFASSSKRELGITLEESSKQSKFNCVMCDNHFLDLIQLESHVKSHNEVLHFSILLKKVVSNTISKFSRLIKWVII